MTGPCPKMPCDSVEGGVENNTEFKKGKIFSLKITSRESIAYLKSAIGIDNLSACDYSQEIHIFQTLNLVYFSCKPLSEDNTDIRRFEENDSQVILYIVIHRVIYVVIKE